jgi:20S proteasome subunit alpha 6
MEAVKQGSCAVGLRSKTHVVLCTLKRSSSELSTHQKKLFKIDEHCGIAISGLTADARVLAKYMRNECLNHRWAYEDQLPVGRLVRSVADKSQVKTHRSSARPYGVGLLVAGVDQSGPHLFQTCPSANYYEYKAMALGARSQSSKTYLERHFESFEDCGVDSLIKHGLLALREATQSAETLTAANCAISVVSADTNFVIVEDEKIQPCEPQPHNPKLQARWHSLLAFGMYATRSCISR